MKKVIWYILTLPCLWVACMEDKGNYNYVEVNEISIDTLRDQKLEKWQILNVIPKVTCSQPDHKLEYLWYSYVGKTLEVDTISTEEELNWKVNLGIGEYDIFLKVTDENSGLSAKNQMKLKVVGQFDVGLMVLGEKNGEIDLVFINEAGNVINVYDANQPSGDIGRNPIALGNTIVRNNNQLTDVFLLSDDGGKILEGGALTPRGNITDLFYITPKDLKPEAYYKALEYGQNAQADYIISNGKLHPRSTSADMRTGKIGSFNPYISGDYDLSPYAIVNGNANLFYDNKNGRFLALVIDTWGLAEKFSLLRSQSNEFDPSDVGAELIYMAEGKTDGSIFARKGRGYGIFRNKQNQLERLIFSLENYNRGKLNMSLLNRAPVSSQAVGIDQASGYAMSCAIPFMYYSKGSKIYSYDLVNNNCYPVYDVDTIPELSNSTIDRIYLEYFIHYDGFASGEENYNSLLYVSSSAEGQGEKSGTIHVLKLADNGTIEGRQALYKNVCEKTVSMVYKR